MDIGFAYFETGADAGTVTVNGRPINKKTEGSSVYSTSIYSTNPSSSLDLYWNRAIHGWNVSGAGNLPGFTLDVSSPTTFIVRTPQALSLISKSSALDVTWTGASAASPDSMMIVLVPVSGGGTTYTATASNIVGSYSIAASHLSGYSGDVLLEIVKYRYAMKTVNSKTFVGISEIVNTVNFKIQ